MKNRFDELGIEIPFPQQTITFGEDKQGNAVPGRIVVEDEQASGQLSTKRAAKRNARATQDKGNAPDGSDDGDGE